MFSYDGPVGKFLSRAVVFGVLGFRQAGDTDACGVNLIENIQANEERSNRLDLPCSFEWTSADRPNAAANFIDELYDRGAGVFIAAHQDIAVDLGLHLS